jgi:hypothetical protein
MAFGLSGWARQQRRAGKFYLTTQGKPAASRDEPATTKIDFTNPIE